MNAWKNCVQNLNMSVKDVYKLGTKYVAWQAKSIQMILYECLHKFVDDEKL